MPPPRPITRIFLSRRGDPTCYKCRYNLTGLPTRGNCPECGELYNTYLLQVPPGMRRRLLYLRALIVYLAKTFRPSIWTIAIWMIVLGNALFVCIVAWMAMRPMLSW